MMDRLRVVRILAWGPLVLSALCLAAILVLVGKGCPQGNLVITAPLILTSAGFSLLSLLIIYHRPSNRIGRLSAFIGVFASLMSLVNYYVECGLVASDAAGGSAPAGVLAALVVWLNYVLPWAGIAAMFVALPLLFPDGHFLSPGWRRFALISISTIAILGLAIGTLPGTLQYNGMGVSYPYENPLALPVLPEEIGPALNRAINAAIIISALGAIFSQLQRWRQSAGDTRQQLKWFAFFLATAVTLQMIIEMYGALVNPAIFTVWNGLLYSAVLILVFGGFPLTVGIAVFKYRLYDIDVIIRKTLVYGVLTGVMALVYFGLVVGLQSLVGRLTGEESPVAIVVSTLVIAALFTPLRGRVQGVIDRRFFRQKYNAEQVLARFGRTARDEVDLEVLTAELTAVVQETMRPEGVSVWLKETLAAPRQPRQLRKGE